MKRQDLSIGNRIVAIVQGTTNDLYDSRNEKDYCIHYLKESSLFDSIVIASPDTKESNKIKHLSLEWGVGYFCGDNYNVLNRFLTVAKIIKPTIIARVQLRALWVDVDMIKKSVDKIKEGYEYIDYDNNTNYALGADVFTYKALIKASNIINNIDEESKRKIYEFSPWALMNNRRVFDVGVINYRNMWDKIRVKNLKKRLDQLIGQEENKAAVNSKNPDSRYLYIRPYLKSSDDVLDIACGQGGGTKFLSQFCNKIIGVDRDISYINNAINSYSDKSTAFYCMTDKELESLNIKFGKIVSLHTLEHVDDDRNFLLNLKEALKPDGLLLLEVPRLLKYPLGEPLWPFHKREYEAETLKNLLLKCGFEILGAKGNDRHVRVPIEKAREGLFFICRKIN